MSETPTDQTPALPEPTAKPAHPIRLVNGDDLRRSRLTVFFRLFLVIPQLIWFYFWSVAVFFAAIVAWVYGLVAGRIPLGLHLFFAAYTRYQTQLFAYLWIAANPYPGFTGGPYPVDVRIADPVQQSRLTIGFRLLLAIPALFVANILQNVGGLIAIAAWFIGLFTAKVPKGLQEILAYCLRYQAQTVGYVLFLTQRYPSFADD